MWTLLSIGVNSWTGYSTRRAASCGECQISPHGPKNAFPWMGDDLMRTGIAKGAIVTIRVISRGAIIITMGLILTVIGTSIYGMLIITH